MDRKLLIVAVAASVACWKGEASVGLCKADADCGANSTCNQSLHVCQYACAKLCATNEVCLGGACVAQGPEVKQVTAPATWSRRSQPVTVTAVVDGSSGPGIESATLQIAGQADITGTTADTGLVRTYTFLVAGAVQAAGAETPIDFTITAKDTGGQSSLQAALGHGQLLIDDSGPSLVSGVVVNGGVAVSGIKWFKAAASGNIDVQTSIQDAGSGVKQDTLTLVSAGRLDVGTPACAPGANAQTLTCHFSVPLSTVAAGSQRRIAFAVAGTDAAGNAVKTNTAALGIDGKAPTITFTTAYPVAGADCASDQSLYCGHDGSHFWRAGDGKYNLTFTVSDVYLAPDDQGSGADQAGSTCSIAGSALACTVTYDTATSSFTFPANFADATFSSGADGSGSVSVTAHARDAVGNDATPVVASVDVTRLKWMRSMIGKVDTFKGSPIATTQPVPQVVLAGSERDGAGPLVSLGPDGSVLWRPGHSEATTVSNNVAYSSATRRVYVLGDNATKLFAYAVGSTGTTGSYSCALDDGLGNLGAATGSPALIGVGAAERALVADSGLHRLWLFGGNPATSSCTSLTWTDDGGNWKTNVNPPTTDGALIYLGHDVSKLSSVTPNLVTVADAPSFAISINGPVSLATALFFANRSVPAQLFSYSSAFVQNWATSGTALADAVNVPVVVGTNYAFASPLSGDGHLHAFNKATGTEAWKWDPASTIGNVSAPAIGASQVIYFGSDSPTKQLVVLKVVADVPSAADHWGSAYKGSGTQKTVAPVIDTTVDGLTTEPVIDSTGVLYFATGTANAKVFALITDSTGPLAPVAGSTWPRVGYDNCNSSNTAFVCQ